MVLKYKRTNKNFYKKGKRTLKGGLFKGLFKGFKSYKSKSKTQQPISNKHTKIYNTLQGFKKQNTQNTQKPYNILQRLEIISTPGPEIISTPGPERISIPGYYANVSDLAIESKSKLSKFNSSIATKNDGLQFQLQKIKQKYANAKTLTNGNIHQKNLNTTERRLKAAQTQKANRSLHLLELEKRIAKYTKTLNNEHGNIHQNTTELTGNQMTTIKEAAIKRHKYIVNNQKIIDNKILKLQQEVLQHKKLIQNNILTEPGQNIYNKNTLTSNIRERQNNEKPLKAEESFYEDMSTTKNPKIIQAISTKIQAHLSKNENPYEDMITYSAASKGPPRPKKINPIRQLFLKSRELPPIPTPTNTQASKNSNYGTISNTAALSNRANLASRNLTSTQASKNSAHNLADNAQKQHNTLESSTHNLKKKEENPYNNITFTNRKLYHLRPKEKQSMPIHETTNA